MSEYKFYKPVWDGIPDTDSGIEDFIKFNNDSYYLGNNRVVYGVTQSCRYVEDEIDSILETGINNKIDIMHILAWKIGRVKHSETNKHWNNEKKWYYYKGCENTEEGFIQTSRGKEINCNNFANFILYNLPKFEKDVIENRPQEILNALRDNSPEGIGTIYLITLLYFISKGKYPIYDRFADLAIQAIIQKEKPGTKLNHKEPVTKGDNKFDTIYIDTIKPFSKRIEKAFHSYDKYLKNRDLDRALWVYGHCFS